MKATFANIARLVLIPVVSLALISCEANSTGESLITPPPVTYTLGATVSGLVGAGLRLRDGMGGPVRVSSNGPVTLATGLANQTDYRVTVMSQPSGPAQTCQVVNGSGTIEGANVTKVAVACVTMPTP